MTARTRGLIWGLIGVGMAQAQPSPPPLLTGQTQHHYEIRSSCFVESARGTRCWLAGQVKVPQDPWAPPQWGRAFLSGIDESGQSCLELIFGIPGSGASVECVAQAPDGSLYLAGYSAGEVGRALKSQGTPDWSKESFVAHLDARGQLLESLEFSARGNGEPYVRPRALRLLSSGQVALALDFEGQFYQLSSASNQGALALLSPKLALTEVVGLGPDTSVAQVLEQSGQLLLAGTKDQRPGPDMAPPVSRPALWQLLGQKVGLLWSGEVHSNTEILQLREQDLLFGDNDREATQLLRLSDLKLEELPAGIRQLTSGGPGSQLAWGFANGALVGTESIGDCDAVLWRQQAGVWTPWLRVGSKARDFPAACHLDAQGHLRLLLTSEGKWPDREVPPPHSAQWALLHSPGLPTPALAQAWGQRQPGSTLAQLRKYLAESAYPELPGYQHFVGFLEPPLVVTTTAGAVMDGWAVQDLSGTSKLAYQTPVPTALKQPPLEPQIFPHLAGQQMLCREFDQGLRWFALDPQRREPTGQGSLSGQPLACQGTWADSSHKLYALLQTSAGLLLHCQDPQGQQLWRRPLRSGDLGLALSGQSTASGKTLLACAVSLKGKLRLSILQDQRALATVALEGERLEALAWSGERLWLAHRVGEQIRLSLLDLQGRRRQSTSLKLPTPAWCEISKMQPYGSNLLLGGSWKRPGQEEDWSAFVALVAPASGKILWQTTLQLDRASYLKDFRLQGPNLWLGGEIYHDYVSDTFWGRLAQPLPSP